MFLVNNFAKGEQFHAVLIKKFSNNSDFEYLHL